MVTDDDRVVREQADRLISAAREQQTEEPRIFAIPAIDFEAVSYTDMISWSGPVTQPPLLRDLSDGQLRDIVQASMAIPPYPFTPRRWRGPCAPSLRRARR